LSDEPTTYTKHRNKWNKLIVQRTTKHSFPAGTLRPSLKGEFNDADFWKAVEIEIKERTTERKQDKKKRT